MDQPYSFDDLNNEASYIKPTKPIYSINLDDPANEKDILEWLKNERGYLETEARERTRVMRRNLALYKGIQYQEIESRIDARDRAADRSMFMRKIVANHLYDLTKNRASRLVKFRPAVAILPTNDELEDKLAAKSCKMLLDHIWYELNFDGIMQVQLATYAQIMGEVYLFITWDKNKGDISPAFLEAQKKNENKKIPLLDENGRQVIDSAGNKMFVDRVVRIGDVDYKIIMATDVLLQKKKTWQEVDYVFTAEVVGTDYLRMMYPEKAGSIKDQDIQIYDYEKMEMVSTRRETMLFTFWHRRSEQMDKGRKIVFTNDVILENTEFPFSHDQLPCVRFTDQENPGELHGHSFFDQIKGLTGTYNNLTNMIIRNLVMVSHPKWMVPVGSTAIDSLGNDITIVQYKGAQPPILATAQSVPADVFKFRGDLKEEFQQISGVFGVSRGEPPPGIKAGVALQFLSEQESERYNELVLKWNETIKAIAQMTLQVAADYYDESDRRMVRVLGKNNEYMIDFFKVSSLEKDYDIRIQNSSALPKSVAARTQTLLDLAAQFPDQFTGEQVIDMLDLAQNDKFIDAATVAVRSAEAENEKLYEVKDDVEMSPEEYENHIVHWRIHVRQMQEFRFKYKTSKDIQQKFRDHVLTHEYFMTEQSKRSPKFAEQLLTLPQFPMFYIEQTQMQLNAGSNQLPVSQTPNPMPSMGSMGLASGLPVNPQDGLPVNPKSPNMEQFLNAGNLPSVEPTKGI